MRIEFYKKHSFKIGEYGLVLSILEDHCGIISF